MPSLRTEVGKVGPLGEREFQRMNKKKRMIVKSIMMKSMTKRRKRNKRKAMVLLLKTNLHMLASLKQGPARSHQPVRDNQGQARHSRW